MMRKSADRLGGGPMRAALVGAAFWFAAVAAAAMGVGELTLVDAMMLLAVLAIVPAAVPLHPAGSARASAVTTAVALPVAPALLVEQGAAAAALVAPWVVAAGAGALICARRWWTANLRLEQIIWPAAAAYLLVGAGWLLADRLGLQPGGFAPPFVQLTAVHFHYAGFVSSVLVGCAWQRCPTSRAAATAAVCTVTAPAIIAVGFTYVGLLQIFGAALLTLGIWLLAWVTVRRVAPHVGLAARSLLTASSIASLLPMALAVQWAAGANLGTPALSIPEMARAHGVTNAVGFALLGVVGWRLAETATDAASIAGSPMRGST